MPRGRIPLIPLAQIHDFIAPINPEAFEQDTIDVFLRFEEGHVTLLYKGEALEVTGYVLLGE
jgi:hypothetical protein